MSSLHNRSPGKHLLEGRFLFITGRCYRDAPAARSRRSPGRGQGTGKQSGMLLENNSDELVKARKDAGPHLLGAPLFLTL